jgi:hypothetical protein
MSPTKLRNPELGERLKSRTSVEKPGPIRHKHESRWEYCPTRKMRALISQVDDDARQGVDRQRIRTTRASLRPCRSAEILQRPVSPRKRHIPYEENLGGLGSHTAGEDEILWCNSWSAGCSNWFASQARVPSLCVAGSHATILSLWWPLMFFPPPSTFRE